MKLTKQYLAGFIDGEGYLGIGKKKDARIKRGYTIRYRIYITNQHKGLLEEIQKLYGGRLKLKKNQKECYDLMIDTKKPIIKILKNILPYLIIKQEKAKFIYDILMERKNLKQGNRIKDTTIKKII